MDDKKGPTLDGLWLMNQPKCDHDYQPMKPGFYMCSQCQRIQPEHMLTEVEGKWVEKPVKVIQRRPRRR